jgi:hypothetical protein
MTALKDCGEKGQRIALFLKKVTFRGKGLHGYRKMHFMRVK